MVTDFLGKLFTEINIITQRVWQNQCSGTESVDKAEVVWRNCSERLTEKQTSVNNCTRPPKKKTPPIYINRCGFGQKGYGCPYKASMDRLKTYKWGNSVLCKIILQKTFSITSARFCQLAAYSTTGEFSQQNPPTIRIQCPTCVEIEKIFPLQEAIYNYNKTQVCPYDFTKLAIRSILRPVDDLISNCGQNFRKTVTFDDIVSFFDEEKNGTYVDFVDILTKYFDYSNSHHPLKHHRNVPCFDEHMKIRQTAIKGHS